MALNTIHAEYQELWKEYGIEELPVKAASFSTSLPTAGEKKATSTKLMFIGDYENTKEAEQLLNKIIEAMGYSPKDIPVACISDISNNLERVKTLIQANSPAVLIALGEKTVQALSGKDLRLTDARGKWMKLHWNEKPALMATYAPDHILKNPAVKKTVWEDMKLVMSLLA